MNQLDQTEPSLQIILANTITYNYCQNIIIGGKFFLFGTEAYLYKGINSSIICIIPYNLNSFNLQHIDLFDMMQILINYNLASYHQYFVGMSIITQYYQSVGSMKYQLKLQVK